MNEVSDARPEIGTGAAQPALKTPASLKAPVTVPPAESYRGRVVRFIGVIALLLVLWWGAGYVFAFTDDAFVDSNVVTVATEVTGPVSQVYVHDNQRVVRGAPLFSLDATPFSLEVQHARNLVDEAQAQLGVDAANVDGAQANVRAAEAALHLANVTNARIRSLSGTDASYALEADTGASGQQQKAAALAAANAALMQARQTLALHREALASARTVQQKAEWEHGRTQVAAPLDGTVTHLTLSPGDTARANAPVVAIVSGDDWHVTANFKEFMVRHLSVGQTAWVWLDTRPWHLYRAHVQGIGHAISRESGEPGLVPYVSPGVDWIRLARRLPVRVELDHPPADLYAGADARVLVSY